MGSNTSNSRRRFASTTRHGWALPRRGMCTLTRVCCCSIDHSTTWGWPEFQDAALHAWKVCKLSAGGNGKDILSQVGIRAEEFVTQSVVGGGVGMSVPICKAIGCTSSNERLVMVAHAAEAPWQDLPNIGA